MVCKQISQHLDWTVGPVGSPTPTLIHTVQQVPMTGIRDHLGSISEEEHKGGNVKGVGTEKSDMKSVLRSNV